MESEITKALKKKKCKCPEKNKIHIEIIKVIGNFGVKMNA